MLEFSLKKYKPFQDVFVRMGLLNTTAAVSQKMSVPVSFTKKKTESFRPGPF